MKLLADENIPRIAIEHLRDLGYDIIWITDISPGISDLEVMKIVIDQRRILLTFDKDFGEIATDMSIPTVCGIILFRDICKSGADMALYITSIVSSRTDWNGFLNIIHNNRIRMRPLL